MESALLKSYNGFIIEKSWELKVMEPLIKIASFTQHMTVMEI